ncbi:MAG: UMP kinase [Bacilli bacterium]|nr:UMP kinase [Bacilli bacterium]
MEKKYKRIIVKLSGEALADENDKSIYSKTRLDNAATVIADIVKMGVSVGVVVGAGNIWRGRLAETIGIEQAQGDYMGMLGTIINGMAIQSALEEKGIECRVMTSISMPQIAEPYIRRKAMTHLDKGRVVIFAGGLGNPYFTTDSCATLRALEVGADAIFMAKNGVDGVFDSDPRKNKDAKMFKHITFTEVVEKKLGVMDLTAVAMLVGKDVVIRVFNMEDPANFAKVAAGEDIGTTISKE